MHWNQKYLLSHMLRCVALVRYLCGCPMLQAGGISLFGWERIHPDPTASPPSIILGSDTRLGGHGEKAYPPPPVGAPECNPKVQYFLLRIFLCASGTVHAV